MGKVKNDSKSYLRRADISPGAVKKIGKAHRRADADRARQVLEAMTSLERSYFEI